MSSSVFSNRCCYPFLSSYERRRFEKVFWIYYFCKGRGRLILRRGFNDYGVHDRNYLPFCSPNRPEYVPEHENGAILLAMLLFEFFSREYFYGYNRDEVYELLSNHDVGEIRTGDVADDGNRDDRWACLLLPLVRSLSAHSRYRLPTCISFHP